MRWCVGLSVVTMFAGCGGKYKPVEPVISGWERATQLQTRLSGVTYVGGAQNKAPSVPVMAFGAFYDVDLVVAPKKGDIDMYEFARLQTAKGNMWLVKESDRTTGNQLLLADVAEIDALMPEIPLERKATRLEINDNITPNNIAVTMSYANGDGMQVNLDVEGEPANKYNKHRNGNTFGHSRNDVLAVLDIPTTSSLFKAKLKVGEQTLAQEKISGIVPFQFALQQGQGGLASGQYTVIDGAPVAYKSAYAPATVAAPVEEEPPPMAPDVKMKIALASHKSAAEACYTAALENNPEFAGQIQLDWMLINGEVTSVEPVLMMDEGIEDETFTQCVVDAGKSWSFDDDMSGKGAWLMKFEKEADTVKFTMEDPSAPWVFGAKEDFVDEEAAEESEELGDLPDPAVVAEDIKKAAADLADGLDDEEGMDDESLEEDVLDFSTDKDFSNSPLASFQTVHRMRSGNTVTQSWSVEHRGETVVARQTSDLRTLEYSYLVHGGALELSHINVYQYGRAVPVTSVTFSPAIPDLRMLFNGSSESRFVIDINGQENHATGSVIASWSDAGAKLKIIPDAPDWAASRPLVSTISYKAGGIAEVATLRVEP